MHTDDQGTRRSAPGIAACLALSFLAITGFALNARANSWFCYDDYLAFYDMATRPFAGFVTLPVDVHFIPLHRLLAWLLQTLVPFDFDVVLAVMCVFWLGSVWILYRILERIEESPLNGPLAALCGSSFYGGILLLTWTAGIARFACLFFTLAAVHQYLGFRRDGSWREVAVLLVCMVSAATFFSRGLLVPGYLLAIELVLLPQTSRRDAARNAAVIAAAAGVAAAYYVFGSGFATREFHAPPLDWATQARAFTMVVTKLPQSFFGLLPARPLSILNWMVVGFWGVLCVVSVRRDRFNAVVWIVGFATVIANFAAITLSARMVLGAVLVNTDRYYFANLWLIALFLAIIAKRTNVAAWLAQARRGRASVAALWVAVLFLAVASQWRCVEVMSSQPYGDFRKVAVYGPNLARSMADLRRTRQGTLRFMNYGVPNEVLHLVAVEIGTYDKFLRIFDRDVVALNQGTCLYQVRLDGTIRAPEGDCP